MSGPRRRSPRRASRYSRRDFLKRAGAGAAVLGTAPWLPGCSGANGGNEAVSAVFRHGVASGDPLSNRVILWTRVTPAGEGSLDVDYEIATDPAFRSLVGQGRARTYGGRDYTVKLDVTGLAPATSYYYRFRAGNETSPVGRTRTAPVGSVERLRVGVASCSSYAHGYFNAYRQLAARADLDVVLHLGDYIYEYGTAEYGDTRAYEPDHEILTLADYRARHALYKRDPDLQAVHRQHPFITVWDDHETADNGYRDGANNHSEGTEGTWAQRRAWAIQAYYEWMPIREVEPGRPDRIFRSFRYGDLADITMLDTRLFGRDRQAGLTDAGSINDAGRQLLGAEQRDFRAQALGGPARWKLLGQQVMFGQLRLGLPELSAASGVPVPELQAAFNQLPVVSTGGLVINTDQWDGYRAERQRVFEMIAAAGGGNVVVLTGDIHTSWAMDLSPDPNNPLAYNPLSGEGSRAVEFVCTSVTSPGLEEVAPVADAIRVANPHIKYVDLARKGYLLLDITPQRVNGEFWFVDRIDAAADGESFGAAFATLDGSQRLGAGEQTAPRSGAPAPAP
jgi:alkaline phosphatase D